MTSAHPELWSFIVHAGPVVKAVMLLLVTISILSWTFILQKFFFLQQTKRLAQKFEETFWSEVNLHILDKMNTRRKSSCGLARIFRAGLIEFNYLFRRSTSKTNILEGSERAMEVAKAKEVKDLEYHLPFLATIGSISPYIGLFGTVWGIMTSFTTLGNAQQVTIAMVAPGIAEALIATAIGLFTAIPAVIAYNRYTYQVDHITHQYEIFQGRLMNLFHRKLHTPITPQTHDETETVYEKTPV